MGLQRLRRIGAQADEMTGGRLPDRATDEQRKTISAAYKAAPAYDLALAA